MNSITQDILYKQSVIKYSIILTIIVIGMIYYISNQL